MAEFTRQEAFVLTNLIHSGYKGDLGILSYLFVLYGDFMIGSVFSPESKSVQ